MYNIGYYVGAFKPFHKGHWEVIKQAKKECDIVYLFISTKDRERKGEIKVCGKSMYHIWNVYLEKHLICDRDPTWPGVIRTIYSPEPVKMLYDYLIISNSQCNVYVPTVNCKVYGGPEEMRKIFGNQEDIIKNEKLKNLIDLNLLSIIETPRITSSTKVRKFIQENDFCGFAKEMPDFLNNTEKESIFNILRKEC